MTAPLGRERTSLPVEETIIEFLLKGYGPTQIFRELQRVAPREGYSAPSLRTIQRIASRMKPSDSSGPWKIEDMSPADARIVLDFIAQMASATNGRLAWISREEAFWISRLRQLVPILKSEDDWDYGLTLRLAYTYMSRRERGESTTDLDMFIAYSPWECQEAAEAYAEAVSAGYAPAPPSVCLHIANEELWELGVPEGRYEEAEVKAKWAQLAARQPRMKDDANGSQR